MGRQGPETVLLSKMRTAAREAYGSRLVMVKYHGSQFGEAGVSDLLCCLDGIFVAVEVKHPGTSHGRAGLTVKQQAFGNRVIEAGGIFLVCYSVEALLENLALIARGDHDQQITNA